MAKDFLTDEEMGALEGGQSGSGGFISDAEMARMEAGGNASTFDRVKDFGVDLMVKGPVALGESVVGVADLVTGNMAGKALNAIGYDPKETRRIVEDWYSPERQSENREVADTKGFFNTVNALVHNPAVALGSIAESAPMMLGTAGAVRAAATKMLAAEGLAVGSAEAGAFLARPDVLSKLATIGSAGEGALTAGSIQEQARQEGADWSDSAGYAAAGGAITGVIGKAASKILPDADVLAGTAGLGAGQKATLGQVAKNIGKGMVQEGVLEELPQSAQEQVFTNLATDKPWDEGVAEAAAQGMVSGVGMGGGMSTYRAGIDSLRATKAAADLKQATDATEATDAAMRLADVDLTGAVAEAGAAIVDYHNLDSILQEGDRQTAVAEAAANGEAADTKSIAGEDPIDRFDGWTTENLLAMRQQNPTLTNEIDSLLAGRAARDARREQHAELSRQLQGQKRTDLRADEVEIDPVRGFVTEQRNTNTPAAQAFVRDYEAGRITDAEIAQRIQQEQSRNGMTESERRISAAAEGGQLDMTAPPAREDRTQAMIRDYMGKQANVAQRTQAQQLADNEAGQFSTQRAELVDEIPAERPRNRPLDRAELQALRSAAARLENPQAGTFLRVTDDGVAIATGEKGTRIPDAFRKFAEDNGLTFRAERKLPTPDRGTTTAGGNVTHKSEPMPIAYRKDGALYFGEMGADNLDRTDKTRFSNIRVEPNVNGHQVVTAPAGVGDQMRDAFKASGVAAIRIVNNAKEVAFRIGKTVAPERVQAVVAQFSNNRQDIPTADDIATLEANAMPLPEDDMADISPRRKPYVKTEAAPAAVDPADQADLDSIVAAVSKEFGDVRGDVRIVSEAELDNTGDARPNRVSKKQAKVIRTLFSIFKKRVVFFDSKKITAGGFVGGDANTIYLKASDVDIDWLVTAGHELMHLLSREVPLAYKAVSSVIERHLTGEQLAAFKRYYQDQTLSRDAAVDEIASDIAGNMMSEASFWQEVFNEIAEQHGEQKAKGIITRLAAKLYAMIDKAVAELKINRLFKTDTMVSNLSDIRAAIKEATKTYAEFKRTDAAPAEQWGETQYSKQPGSDNGHKRTKSGDYVGAPAGMTPGKLGALRLRLHKLTQEGTPGRFWYEESSDAILAAAEGDKALAEKIAGLLAIYSPTATVSANTSMGLKALYQWMNGETIKVRFGVQDKKAQAWMDGTMAEDAALQIKTGNFFINLMRKIDEARYGYEQQGATIDMWMARVFGYNSKAIGSGARYYFAERETKKIAEELGWEPQQVQAALWVSIKSRIEAIDAESREIGKKNGWLERKVTKSGGKENISWQPIDGESREKYEALKLKMALGLDDKVAADGIASSKYNFGTALRERIGQISWEAMPGKTTGVLPGIFNAPLEQQVEYLAAIDAALRDENGNDLIAAKLGLPVLQTAFGPSAWQMNVGAGAQTEVAVATDRDSKNKIVVNPNVKNLLNIYAAIRGYVLAQEAVVWHYPVFDAAKKNANGVQLDFGRDPTHDEVVELYNAIHEASGREDWAPAYVPGVGVRVLNFAEPQYDKKEKGWSYWDAAGNEHKASTKEALLPLAQADGVDNSTFQGVVREAAKRIDAKVRFGTFQSDGDYIGNDWGDAPNGEQYKEIIDGYNRGVSRGPGRSDLQGWVESELRPRTERVNKEFAKKYGWDRAKFSTQRSGSDAASSGRDRVLAESGSREVPEYGRATEGSVSVIGQHWSKEKRSNLNGSYYGTGASGAERPRVMAAKDRRLRNRIYFYVHKNGDQTDVTPEAGVGSVRHDVRLNNLYDALNNSEIQKSVNVKEIDGWPVQRNSADWSNLFEAAVIDAGYDGYVTVFGDQRAAVLIGEHVVETGAKFSPARAQTETPEFKRWFGDSKVVDADGKPLVVYHGTARDFDAFAQGAQGDNFGDYEGAFPRDGFWFTDSPSNAAWYAHVSANGLEGERAGGGQRSMPVYLSISNPYRYTAEMFAEEGEAGIPSQFDLESQGYDGLIVELTSDEEIATPEADAMWSEYTPIHGAPINWPAGLRAEYEALLDVPPVVRHTHYVAFKPEQIKSATGNNGQFDPANPDIRFSLPRQSQWYYSNLSRQVEAAPEKVFSTAKQVKAWLLSNKAKLGIKDDEIQWTGISDWLDMQTGKVSKADVLAYLDANGVQVQEVVKGASSDKQDEYNRRRDEITDLRDRGGRISDHEANRRLRSLREDLGFDEYGRPVSEAKYGQYVLPGGENYRELLLTLPDGRKAANDAYDAIAAKARAESRTMTADEIAERNRLERQVKGEGQFKSSHWPETPNILAHIRYNDRTDADGNKVLFIEEIQGDWPQQYRKQSEAIGKAVDSDFLGIVERMKKDGVLEVNCD